MKALCLASTALALVSVSAFAADLPSRGPAKPGLAYQAPTWAGFYAGGSLGIGRASTSADYAQPEIWDTGDYSANPARVDKTFGALGAQVGYNWQVNSFVFGGEADAAFLFGGKGSVLGTYPDSYGFVQAKIGPDALASLRARAGYDFAGTLVYGTLGYGWIHASNNLNVLATDSGAPKGGAFKADKWAPAFVLGVGAERMLTQTISLRGDVQQYYGATTKGAATDTHYFTAAAGSVKYKSELTVLRVGLNYHF